MQTLLLVVVGAADDSPETGNDCTGGTFRIAWKLGGCRGTAAGTETHLKEPQQYDWLLMQELHFREARVVNWRLKTLLIMYLAFLSLCVCTVITLFVTWLISCICLSVWLWLWVSWYFAHVMLQSSCQRSWKCTKSSHTENLLRPYREPGYGLIHE